MQRGAIRVLDANSAPFDAAFGIFTAALPVMTYDSLTNTFKGAASNQLGVELTTASTTIATTTLSDITGLALTLPRAGTFVLDGMLDVALGTAGSTAGFGISIPGVTFTRASIGYHVAGSAAVFGSGQQTGNLAAGGAVVASTPYATAAGRFPTVIKGSVVVTGACIIQVMAGRSAGTLTIAVGSYLRAAQIA